VANVLEVVLHEENKYLNIIYSFLIFCICRTYSFASVTLYPDHMQRTTQPSSVRKFKTYWRSKNKMEIFHNAKANCFTAML